MFSQTLSFMTMIEWYLRYYLRVSVSIRRWAMDMTIQKVTLRFNVTMFDSFAKPHAEPCATLSTLHRNRPSLNLSINACATGMINHFKWTAG